METTPRRAAVLDTSAFVAGFDPFSLEWEEYTVPMVKEEMTGSSMPEMRFEAAITNGILKVKAPNEECRSMVKSAATLVGDKFFLSETDLQLLALALQLKTEGYFPLIVTDDYSIQNVADQMGIEFASLLTFGIRRRLTWMRYCPACHKEYPADSKSKACIVCGTKLKRKPLRKSLLSQDFPKT